MAAYGQDTHFHVPITDDEDVEVYGYNSVMFVNRGNVPVIFDDKYTLPPGEGLPFGNGGIVDGYVSMPSVKLRFDTTGVTDPVKKVEWVTTKYEHINIPPCK